jgi:hypothetical protein
MSIASLLLPRPLGGVMFLFNLLGASGDLYMSYRLMKFHCDSKIIDKIYGFDVV